MTKMIGDDDVGRSRKGLGWKLLVGSRSEEGGRKGGGRVQGTGSLSNFNWLGEDSHLQPNMCASLGLLFVNVCLM
jgi:hypothetical protein